MKRTLVLISLILILASTNAIATEWEAEAFEIPYQIEHSDRIIIGNVTDVQQYYNYSIVTIEIDEWLMGSLSAENITLRTEIGTNVDISGEPVFSKNENVLLVLTDINLTENRFKVFLGEPGKHPLSDKDTILKELGVESETTEFTSNENKSEPEPENKTDEENSGNAIPLIGLAGISIAVSGAFLLLRKHD